MKNFLLLQVFCLSLICNAQNTCNTAQTITPGTYTTDEIDGINIDNGCWDTTPREGIHAEWYKYTPLQDGILRLNTNFAANDGIQNSNHTKVSVYSGDCNNLDCVMASDGDVYPPSNFVDDRFEVRVGTSYYIAFDDFYSAKKLVFELSLEVSDCNTTLPFTEKWLTHLDYTCWKSYSADNYSKWIYYDVMNFNSDPYNDPVAASYPTSIDPLKPKNEWLISSGMQLEAGLTYNFSIKYNAMQYGNIPIAESFRAVILNNDYPQASEQTVIGEVTGIVQQGALVPPYNMDLATTVTYAYTPMVTGAYHFGLHANAAKSSSMLIVYEVKAEQGVLSDEDFTSVSFLVYPNPATGYVTVTGRDITAVELIDTNGRVVLNQKYNNITSGTFDVSAVQSGIYLLKVISPNGMVLKKLIKE